MRLVPSESIQCSVCAPSDLIFKTPVFPPEPETEKRSDAACFKAAVLRVAARLLDIIAFEPQVTAPSTQFQVSLTCSARRWQLKLQLLLCVII